MKTFSPFFLLDNFQVTVEPLFYPLRKRLASIPTIRPNLFNGAESRIKCNTLTLSGVAMGTNYEQLSAEERATIMLMAQEGKSARDGEDLHRSPWTISREWRRQGQRPMPLDRGATMPRRLAKKRGAGASSRAGSVSWPLTRCCSAWSSISSRRGGRQARLPAPSS